MLLFAYIYYLHQYTLSILHICKTQIDRKREREREGEREGELEQKISFNKLLHVCDDEMKIKCGMFFHVNF